jgi:hypothetical protein
MLTSREGQWVASLSNPALHGGLNEQLVRVWQNTMQREQI